MIHAFTTGRVQIRQSQIVSETQGGALELLTDDRWSEWLPITAWLIDHPDGLILVDTGETARTMEPGYLPRLHPYYRRAVNFDVQPEDEIDVQLRAAGVSPADIRHVVLTHLHTDHAGGLHHFPDSTIWADEIEMAATSGIGGWLSGYLRQRWPSWFAPKAYRFDSGRFGTFDRSMRLTQDGAVHIVPTPGHSPGHVSVIVRTDDRYVVLAGDASYTEGTMRSGRGGAIFSSEGFDSLQRLQDFVDSTGALYLPTHEIGVAERLRSALAVA